MPSKQSRRRDASTGFCDKRFVQRGPDMVDSLAFKYMEMCKVDSSSDSESDTSPRWSDASIKSLQGCTGPKRSSLSQTSCGRHFPQPLDPYDGCSEDSASSDGAPKRPKHQSLRTKGRGRRPAAVPLTLFKEVKRVMPRDCTAALHLDDVQMKSASDSELKSVKQQHQFSYMARKCGKAEKLEYIKCPLGSSTFSTDSPLLLADGETESFICPHMLSKRKLFCPLGDAEECEHRKKQCVSQMETETILTEVSHNK